MTLATSYPPVTVSGTVTSWLPITSAWPAQPACSTLVWEGYPPYQVIDDPGYGIYVDGALSCLPPAATVWWEQDHTVYGTTTLSLGPIVCPSAYTTALTSVQDSSTFVACCPSGYNLLQVKGDGQAGQCLSTLTAGQRISLIIYETITNSNELASAWVTSVSNATKGMAITGIQVNGWNFIPTTSASSISLSPTSPASSSPSSPPASASSTTNNDTARNIGIGVGVSLGAIGILSICFAIWYVRRRRSASRGNAGPQSAGQMPPANREQPGYWAPVHEIDSSKVPVVAEMHTHYVPTAELEGTR